MEQLLYWLVGGLGVPLINWLKEIWGLRGRAAMWLTAAVAAALGTAALVISQQLTLPELTPEAVLAVFGQVLAAATLAYKLLTEQE